MKQKRDLEPKLIGGVLLVALGLFFWLLLRGF